MNVRSDLAMAYYMGYEDALAKRMPNETRAGVLNSCNRSSNCTNGERTETCHDKGTFNSWGLFTCSNCSVVFPLDAVKDAPSIGRTLLPKYCPNCGRKVVDA